MHASLELPGGCSTLSRADGLPLRCKGQRLYWAKNPMGVWLTEKGEVQPNQTHTRTFTLCWTKKTEDIGFFRHKAAAPGVCHPGLEEGLHFTDGRADVSRGLSAQGFSLHDLLSVHEKRCGMWKMSSWFQRREINFLCMYYSKRSMEHKSYFITVKTTVVQFDSSIIKSSKTGSSI